MMSKTLGVLAIAIIICPVAFAQGGCTEYNTWGMSGYAGDASTGPGGATTWLLSKANEQALHGGIGPSCTYRWISESSSWYGVCVSVGYTCSNPPTSPASSAPETNPGPGCPSCGAPITLATGNTYIPQTDLTISGLGGGLKLTRSWNSLWPVPQVAFSAGLFGNNWRSTYEERVFVGNDGTMKYSRADGSFWSFLLYGSPAIYHLSYAHLRPF